MPDSSTHSLPIRGALPIDDVLPEVLAHLELNNELVLQAPPGAGKTTMVPLALLESDFLGQQKILVLEPRRLAAKAAAERMAGLLGEPVGQRVGYRVRLDSKVSAATQIEVITEGILARMLQDDPALETIGLIIFDEFHERSLDADLGLSLSLQARRLFRNPEEGEVPLKLLVMSATLDDLGLEDLLGECGKPAKVIASEGQQFPVKIHYSEPWQARQHTVSRVVRTIIHVLGQHEGSVLVFLPGQGEIRRAKSELDALIEAGELKRDGIVVAPLFGSLSLDEQRKAIYPAPPGKRKVVLATNLAESSLTIEGIKVVIDSGLSRYAAFDPSTGMTRLRTARISQASSTQRAGRAGRLSEGDCYRLWSESQQSQLSPQSPAEILQADLAPLALQLLCWGVGDPQELDWLDAPPAAAYQQALDLLEQLAAIDVKNNASGRGGGYQVTALGQAMADVPAHPRLAHMLIVSKRLGHTRLASQLAALLSDRDPFGQQEADSAGADIHLRLLELERSKRPVYKRLQQQARQFEQTIKGLDIAAMEQGPMEHRLSEAEATGVLLAMAYPDRIAQQRNKGSDQYLLANGRSATLREGDPLHKYGYLVAAQLGGREKTREDQIFLASELSAEALEGAFGELIETRDTCEWDAQRERFVAERQRCLGAIVIGSKALVEIDPEAKVEVLCQLIRKRGLGLLKFDAALLQWRSRVELMRSLEPEAEPAWPDMSDEGLLAELEAWLGPYLQDVSHIKHLDTLDLCAILKARLPWPLPQALEEALPEKVKVPSGNQHGVDYLQNPPVLAVKLQEMFGQTDTPKLAKGRVSLVMHLLSPARRPLAVTQDLASFWQNAYPEVKKDMKGRYPKHPWPDDPLSANATARVKSKN